MTRRKLPKKANKKGLTKAQLRKKYKLYLPINRISTDQVPVQDLNITRTVDIKGTRRVHIRRHKLRFKKRFCTWNVTVRAQNPQPFKLMIIFKGKPDPNDASIPKSPVLKKQMKDFDPRGLYAWDEKAYFNDGSAKVWFKHVNEISKTNERRLLQTDGYKTLLKPRWRNEFKRNLFKHVISPAGCTDASTSVVDEHIGMALKQKFIGKLNALSDEDPDLWEKINEEGLGFMRKQFTFLACDAWEALIKEVDIPMMFKNCGLCNAVDGSESHLIKCNNLLTYKAPEREFTHLKQPYSLSEMEHFILREIDATSSRKRKRKLKKQLKQIKNSFLKTKN